MDSLTYLYELLQKGCKIVTDSRKIEIGSIFFALKGETYDGNQFAEDALKKGAIAAVVDDSRYGSNPNTILVSNVLQTLQDLAKYHRKNIKIPIIGLTGSNGKTTTKELISVVLKKRYKTFATAGNLNNHIGLPLSILSITKNDDIAVIEMGANHIGEIYELCKIAKPTHGLITNIGKAHLEGFGSIEGVKKAKTELYQHLSKNSGTVFINSSDKLLMSLADEFDFAKRVYYGIDRLQIDSINNDTLLSFNLTGNDKKYPVKTQLTGEYNIYNILAAISIGTYFGVDLPDAIDAIKNYAPKNSRSQIVETQKNTLVLDAYNANPSSMEVALSNFSKFSTHKPKAVILGEMLEMGSYAREEHLSIAELAKQLFKTIILVGNNFKDINGVTRWFANNSDCEQFIKDNPFDGFAILVKGSRGVKLEEVVKWL